MTKEMFVYFGLALVNIPFALIQADRVIHGLTSEIIVHLALFGFSVFTIGFCVAFGTAAIIGEIAW